MSLLSTVRGIGQRGGALSNVGDLYRHAVPLLDGGELDLGSRRGKPTLLVNVASCCAFATQYRGLELLFECYRDRGLLVLGTPSGDFGELEFTDPDQIQRSAWDYLVDFPLTERMSVRFEPHSFWRDVAAQPDSGPPVWNFTKYLIDGEGHVAGWWSTNVRPEGARIRGAIEELLGD